MKNQFVSTLAGLMIAFCPFLLSCNKDNKAPEKENPFRLEANLLMGNRLFLNTLDDRNLENAFEVLEVIRKNDLLEVIVKGGDAAGSFQFIWDGRVQESFPMGIQLIMMYTGPATDFDPAQETTVSVNLQKIIGERNNVDDYHFNVINGSKIQTVTLNPDGTITNEDK